MIHLKEGEKMEGAINYGMKILQNEIHKQKDLLENGHLLPEQRIEIEENLKKLRHSILVLLKS